MIRLLIEKELPLSLKELLKQSREAFNSPENFPSQENDTFINLKLFIYDRLNHNLREQGYKVQEIEAVLSYLPDLLFEIPKRLEAVRAFANLPESASLASTYKRVHNILKKDMDKGPVSGVGSIRNRDVDEGILTESAEIALYQALSNIKPRVDTAVRAGYYTQSLQLLAELKNPIDAFFDQVMVYADNEDLRANRLTLLDLLYKTMNQVADLSKLAS